jgi:hypothetical protein
MSSRCLLRPHILFAVVESEELGTLNLDAAEPSDASQIHDTSVLLDGESRLVVQDINLHSHVLFNKKYVL